MSTSSTRRAARDCLEALFRLVLEVGRLGLLAPARPFGKGIQGLQHLGCAHP